MNPIKVDVMIDLDAEELVACRIDDILMPKWMRPSKRIQKIRHVCCLDLLSRISKRQNLGRLHHSTTHMVEVN